MSLDLDQPTTEAEHDPLQRPDWACVLCPPPRQVGAWRQADDRYVTCSGCDTQLRERLDDVGSRYLQLDSRPGGQGGYGSRGAPGFGSRPPCALHVVALRDPRSSADSHVWVGGDGRVHRESQRPALSVHGVLSCQAWAVAEHRDTEGPSDREDVFGLLRFLSRHISYVTRHAELTLELDRAARDLLGQLRPVTGDARRRIGTCPAAVEEVDVDEAGIPVEADPVACAAPLFAPTNGADTIVCGACGTRWERADWLRLGDLLMHADSSVA